MSEAVTRRGRGRPRKGETVQKVAKTPKVRTPKAEKPAKEPKAVKETVPVDVPVDTSVVIDDFVALREAAHAAMGIYADEAKPDIVAAIKAKKSGASQIHYVHPLSLNVLTGDERINPREFATEEMRVRQVEFGNALVAEGIQKPLVAYIQGDELVLIGGETRLRSVLLAYVRGAVADPKQSKVGLLPVLLEKSGTNDFDRLLRVVTDNDQKPLTQIEIAAEIKRLKDLGEAQGKSKMEVYERIAKAFGKTVTFVYIHLTYMELPSDVIGLLRREPIAVSVAMTTWKKTKNNATETLAALNAAVEKSKASGAKKVMPKHVAPAFRVAVDNTKTETPVSDRKATEAAIAKATELVLDIVGDAKFVMTDDGFVRIDHSASAPSVEWSVEDFTAVNKAFPGKFRLPAELAELLDDETDTNTGTETTDETVTAAE